MLSVVPPPVYSVGVPLRSPVREKRILLPRPWMRMFKLDQFSGVLDDTAAELPRLRLGKLPLPPWPDAQAFSSSVMLVVSTER